MLMNIQNATKRPTSPHPILNLGFRIFFLGSAVFTILSMVLWMVILQGIAPFKGVVTPFYWHGHEMIFGYALAVIAGFLLTAVKTWTNQMMPHGWHLGAIFGAWAMARLCWLGLHATSSTLMVGGALVFDVLFWGMTAFAIIKAVWVTRQMRQLGVVVILSLLMLAQCVFYAGVFMNQPAMQHLALYGALYLVIGMVFLIARRVLPFFVVKGISVDNDGKPNGTHHEQQNSALLDRLSMGGFVGFALCDLFIKLPIITGIFALVCLATNLLRLKNWYHHAIWQKPLLWSLILAFVGMVLSLGLFVLFPIATEFHLLTSINLRSLGLHGLAIFGVGLMTLAMMARVSLGHTGRNIHRPPAPVSTMFMLIVLCGIFRVVLPIFFNDDYMVLILLSQVLWVGAFGLFCASYAGILSSPRTDGLFG